MAVFDYLPIAAHIAVAAMAIARVVALRRRGIRPVVIDPQRTILEQAFDTTIVAVFVFWVYLIVDYADPPGPRWLPEQLDRVLIEAQPVKWLGAAMLAAGVALYAVALRAMGDSWRMGIDRAAHQNPPPLKGWEQRSTVAGHDRAKGGSSREAIREGISDRYSAETSHFVDEPLTQPLPSGERGLSATLVTTGVFARSRNPIYLSFDLIFLGSVAIHVRVVLFIMAIVLLVLFHLQIIREERFLAECYGERFADYRRRVRRYI